MYDFIKAIGMYLMLDIFIPRKFEVLIEGINMYDITKTWNVLDTWYSHHMKVQGSWIHHVYIQGIGFLKTH